MGDRRQKHLGLLHRCLGWVARAGKDIHRATGRVHHHRGRQGSWCFKSFAIGLGATRKEALGAELRSNFRHEPPHHHAPEHHAVGHLSLGILPRFARHKDLNFGVLVLGET